MDENETSAQSVPPAPVGQPPAGPPPGFAPAPSGQPAAMTRPPKTRWRDVIFGWRSAVAVFVAGIILGGLGGAAVTVLVDHGNGNGPTISRFPGGGFGRAFGPYGGQGGGPGSLGGTQGGTGTQGGETG